MVDIRTEFQNILVFHLGADEATLTDNVRFEDLSADSVDLLEIVLACEEKFDVHLSDDVALRSVTVGDLFECVRTKVIPSILRHAANGRA